MVNIDWAYENVLVTGATGFVGGNLAAELVRRGAHVVTVERDRRAVNSLKALGIYDQVSVAFGDIADEAFMARLFNEFEVTVGFHLAAQAIVGTANRGPLSTFKSNIQGTWSVLDGALRSGRIKALVVASSDKAYGIHEELPYRETHRLNGRFPYDASKVCTDVLTQCYHTTYELPVAITRNANTYGPADLNYSRLIPDAIRCALDGRTFEIRSDGKMRRDYLYVSDAVDGYLLLAETLTADAAVRGEAFNFGTGVPTDVLTVCSKIFEQVDNPSASLAVLNQAKYEIPAQFLDIGKAERMWGWKPTTSLDHGLAQTVRWYAAHLDR